MKLSKYQDYPGHILRYLLCPPYALYFHMWDPKFQDTTITEFLAPAFPEFLVPKFR